MTARFAHRNALAGPGAASTGCSSLLLVGPLVSAHMFDRSPARNAERLSALEETLSEIEANPPLVLV